MILDPGGADLGEFSGLDYIGQYVSTVLRKAAQPLNPLGSLA